MFELESTGILSKLMRKRSDKEFEQANSGMKKIKNATASIQMRLVL